MEIIENYLNKPNIKSIGILYLNARDHGRVINAAYENNPNNLLFGPSRSYRSINPNQNFDQD